MAVAVAPAHGRCGAAAQRRHRLSAAHVRMAHELGVELEGTQQDDNHRQERWKAPLPHFIEDLYARTRPFVVAGWCAFGFRHGSHPGAPSAIAASGHPNDPRRSRETRRPPAVRSPSSPSSAPTRDMPRPASRCAANRVGIGIATGGRFPLLASAGPPRSPSRHHAATRPLSHRGQSSCGSGPLRSFPDGALAVESEQVARPVPAAHVVGAELAGLWSGRVLTQRLGERDVQVVEERLPAMCSPQGGDHVPVLAGVQDASTMTWTPWSRANRTVCAISAGASPPGLSALRT